MTASSSRTPETGHFQPDDEADMDGDDDAPEYVARRKEEYIEDSGPTCAPRSQLDRYSVERVAAVIPK